MWAPWFSSERNDASRPVSRSGLAMRSVILAARRMFANLQQRVECSSNTMRNATDLTRPDAFERVYDDHHRSVYAAAFRILGNGAQAQDVVQDVFLRLWRRPRVVRRAPRRARRLPAVDGALARARPVARGPGAGPRVGPAEVRRRRRRTTSGVDERPATIAERARGRRGRARRARPAAAVAARGDRAQLLGRPDGGRDRAAACTSRSAPPRAASGSGWRSCATSAAIWCPRRAASLERQFGHAEPRWHDAFAGGSASAGPEDPVATAPAGRRGRHIHRGGPRLEAFPDARRLLPPSRLARR